MDTQTIIATIIVGISAIIAIRYLVRRFFPELKQKDIDCEDTACKGCPAKKTCSSSEKDI